jgi:photosystem II stability/assembly factor-like uncharacterized protein
MLRKTLTLFSILFLIFKISNTFAVDDYATMAPLAKKSLLLASDKFNSLTVLVGERGHILYSGNEGDTWTQAKVETKATLTNIFLFNEQVGWAVGHDAVILKTTDGAKTWKKVFSAIEEEAPLLDVYFKDALQGIAIGAYGLMFVTEDGGSNWKKTELNLSHNNEKDDDTDDLEFTEVYDLHLNDIANAGNKRFYIATEAGHILRSDDDGKTWLNLNSPYHGSFFGVLPLSFDQVLVYGLRGNIYRSSDAGNTWDKIEIDTKEMLTNANVTSNEQILVTGLGGTLLKSQDNGKTFSTINLKHRNGLSSLTELNDGSLLLTGEVGIQLLTQDELKKRN